MSRNLEMSTLTNYGSAFAAWWMLGHQYGRTDRGIDWLTKELYNLSFADEFNEVCDAVRKNLGAAPTVTFDNAVNALDKRTGDVFEKLLADKLAIDKTGAHISNRRGTTVVGGRIVGHYIKTVRQSAIAADKIYRLYDKGTLTLENVKELLASETFQLTKPIKWRVYAGEMEERLAGDSSVIDDFPDSYKGEPIGASIPNFSFEITALGLDGLRVGVDEGAGIAVLEVREGAQPVDPDAATTGILLGTLGMSAVAFLAATDQNPHARTLADTVADDVSADATNTAGYCRISATTNGVDPIDDHIDGNAGVVDESFVFNTVAIVSGATISVTSIAITLQQGSTAT